LGEGHFIASKQVVKNVWWRGCKNGEPVLFHLRFKVNVITQRCIENFKILKEFLFIYQTAEFYRKTVI